MAQKILVVDDEDDLAELLAFNLREAGYEVIKASSGTEALNRARSSLPDLILLDLMLPELDGMAVCEILRRLPSTSQIPIIMVTAWTSEQSRVLGFEAGAADYVTKPFSPRELILRINRVLHIRTKKEPQDSDGPLDDEAG
jgi:DNA-binding response OmpR family regulator